MKVLITGGAGGIGSTLGYYLFKNDYDVILVDNFRNGYKENLIIEGERFGRFYDLDITSKKFFDLVEAEVPDVVVHLAAITSLPDCESNPSECIKVNVDGTNKVILAAKKFGVRKLVFSSTSAVYENSKSKIFKESEVINPRLFYSLSKKMAEEVCISYRENYNMDITILRLFNVFGRRQDMHRKNPPLINYLIREYLNGRGPVLHSNGNQFRDYVYVDCVSDLIMKCINTKSEHFIFNVCSGRCLSVNEIVNIVKKQINPNGNISHLFKRSSCLWDTHKNLFDGDYPLKKETVSKETNKISVGDNSLARSIFKWQPNIDLEFLISEMCESFRNEEI
jgi:nucleoside-diphosphate-sugar epimerase